MVRHSERVDIALLSLSRERVEAVTQDAPREPRTERVRLTDEQLEALANLDWTDLPYAGVSWRSLVSELIERRAAERESDADIPLMAPKSTFLVTARFGPPKPLEGQAMTEDASREPGGRDAAIERAWQEVFALCKGRGWTMHIPLEETDSDVVISTALQRAEALVAEVRAWREAARHYHDAVETMLNHMGVDSEDGAHDEPSDEERDEYEQSRVALEALAGEERP
jgi:hypothetical protein